MCFVLPCLLCFFVRSSHICIQIPLVPTVRFLSLSKNLFLLLPFFVFSTSFSMLILGITWSPLPRAIQWLQSFPTQNSSPYATHLPLQLSGETLSKMFGGFLKPKFYSKWSDQRNEFHPFISLFSFSSFLASSICFFFHFFSFFFGALSLLLSCACSKMAIKMTETRLEMIHKRRNAVERCLKKDIVELLQNGLDHNAYGRVNLPSLFSDNFPAYFSIKSLSIDTLWCFDGILSV